MEEYQALLKVIETFDGRLLIIKGWAITFSLATLVVAMEKKKRMLLFVVIMSSICFWILEAETKYHQTKYYSRMRAIEISMANLELDKETGFYISRTGNITTPLIDWSWENPDKALTDKILMRKPPNRLCAYWYPHVALPHFFIILACVFLLLSKLSKRKWTA